MTRAACSRGTSNEKYTPIVSALPSGGTAALLCVERDPEACHRSLIAQRLTEQHRVTIEHLRPL